MEDDVRRTDFYCLVIIAEFDILFFCGMDTCQPFCAIFF